MPQIFAVESASQDWLAGVSSFLTSSSNTAWVGPIVFVSAVGYGVIGSLIFYQVVITGHRFGAKPEVHEPGQAA